MTLAPFFVVSSARRAPRCGGSRRWGPAYGRETVGIHFTWVKDMDAVLPVIALVEERLAPYDPRPHWGKLFTAAPADRYPRMDDFRALMRHYDPDGKFTTGYVERFVGA
jgi:xylitol oxidase